ncbi:isoflavone reductase family protein [Lophiotrema nucula]|uniref:Isoflavone reductase family protein n=1 Tax=Lophiotrema nucula TaxID=690887 RepID=A0A6A5YQ04_9PLEO|nr:isoflavone reductase family protein [Lophiotrema nucula]
MAIKSVALIGASGTLGPSILTALNNSPFTPFVLNRESSKSTYSDNTKVLTIPDDLNVEQVRKVFSENAIDALIIAMAGSHVEPAKKLIEAAFNSSVQRIIPADFGSCDSADDATVALLPLMEGKQRVRQTLIDLSSRDRPNTAKKLTWTALVPGHFFDYGLGTSLLKFNVAERKAYLLDGGDIKFSASNLDFIARATVAILQKPDETENKLLYVHSHHVTQNEVLSALEKVTGDKFERIEESSKHELSVARPKMLEGDGDATEEIVAVWGVVASDWKGKEGFANELLGLEEEDLEEVVRRVVGGK